MSIIILEIYQKKLLSVIYGLSVSPSVINIPMDLQTDKARQKKITYFIISLLYRYTIGKYNISQTKYHM